MTGLAYMAIGCAVGFAAGVLATCAVAASQWKTVRPK